MDENATPLKKIKKEESALFRLWQRSTQKREAAAAIQQEEKAEEPTASEPALAAPAAPATIEEEKEENYLEALWSKWKQQCPTAASFLPEEYWDGAGAGQTAEEAEPQGEADPAENTVLDESAAGRPWIAVNTEEIYAKEKEVYIKRLQQSARSYLLAEQPEGGPAPLEDAVISLWVTQDKLEAWLFIIAPQNGGKEVTREALSDALYRAGVTYGLNDDLLERAAAGQLYYRLTVIARGVAPVHGKDGELIDCVPRERTVEVAQNEDGTADYKNTTTIHSISKGAVICQIIQPTEPVSGIDVSGNKVEGRVGRPARVPQSANTEITPDGSALIASENGHILFENDKFVVKTLLVINGDVDNTVGNLDFQGDIKISGDVREGFAVRAKGTVMITGMVEGASIVAGKDIIIEKGMNGNGRGMLEAQGSIRCKFMENCNAYAKEKISAGSIICSHIFCDDTLEVTMGKGVIIGGSCTVVKSLEARTIGSQSNRLTTIVMGNTPNMLSQKAAMEEQLKTMRDTLEEINKTLAYISTRDQALTHNQEIQLKKMRLKRPLLMIQEQQLVKQLEQLVEQMGDVTSSRIKCDMLYPPVRITIGSCCIAVEEVHRKCNIYWTKGEIIIGTI